MIAEYKKKIEIVYVYSSLSSGSLHKLLKTTLDSIIFKKGFDREITVLKYEYHIVPCQADISVSGKGRSGGYLM